MPSQGVKPSSLLGGPPEDKRVAGVSKGPKETQKERQEPRGEGGGKGGLKWSGGALLGEVLPATFQPLLQIAPMRITLPST
jgi:hypothetical protein